MHRVFNVRVCTAAVSPRLPLRCSAPTNTYLEVIPAHGTARSWLLSTARVCIATGVNLQRETVGAEVSLPHVWALLCVSSGLIAATKGGLVSGGCYAISVRILQFRLVRKESASHTEGEDCKQTHTQ